MEIAFGPELTSARARNNRAAAIVAVAAIDTAPDEQRAALAWLFDPEAAMTRPDYEPRWSVLAELGRLCRKVGNAAALTAACAVDEHASARVQVAALRRRRRGLPSLTRDGLTEAMRRALDEHLATRCLGEDWRTVAADALRVLSLSVRHGGEDGGRL